MYSQQLNCGILLILVLIWGIYISDLTTDYPDILHEIIDEPLYKFLFILIIFYITNNNYQLGLILTIIFVLLLTNIPLLSEIEGDESFMNGPPVANCSTYDPDTIYRTGTAYYPLQDNNITMKSRNGIDSKNPEYDNNL